MKLNSRTRKIVEVDSILKVLYPLLSSVSMILALGYLYYGMMAVRLDNEDNSLDTNFRQVVHTCVHVGNVR